MRKSNYAFRLFTGLMALLLITITMNAQTGTNKPDSVQEATIDDLEVKPMRLPTLSEVGGSPFMTPEYKQGNIMIASNKVVPDVPVKFNIYSNAMMLQMDGQEMKLESFYLVTYDEIMNDGTVKHLQFRQGLPDVDNHNSKSVYQVVSDGPKAQLVKYYAQKVEDAATLGDYSRKELVTTEQLYVYTPAGGIKRIKSGKKDLVEALPAMAAKIDEIVTTNNLKLKSEAEIALLIEALNKP